MRLQSSFNENAQRRRPVRVKGSAVVLGRVENRGERVCYACSPGGGFCHDSQFHRLIECEIVRDKIVSLRKNLKEIACRPEAVQISKLEPEFAEDDEDCLYYVLLLANRNGLEFYEKPDTVRKIRDVEIYVKWVNFLMSHYGCVMREYGEPGVTERTPGYQLVKCVVEYITQVHREYRYKMKDNLEFHLRSRK